jgi:predicted transglutaminase-like cysteine proteinase
MRCFFRFLVAGLAGSLIFTALSRGVEPGFGSNLSAGLVEYMVARFGPPAKPRLLDWSAFLRKLPKSAPTDGKYASESDRRLIKAVNSFFNRVPFIDDLRHWGVEDYWASPAEFVASHGGDCEDFSIAKYYALKELGVPITGLRITYVKATRINQPHMVLAYYPKPDADPLILDNLVNEVRPSSERPDLIPVYSFNDDDVWISRDGRPGGRSGGRSTQIRLWRELLEKLAREARL